MTSVSPSLKRKRPAPISSSTDLIVIDVDDDGERMMGADHSTPPTSSCCPFLPLHPKTISACIKWWRFIRRFGSIAPCTDDECQGADKTFPILLTELYSKFFQRYHTGAMSSLALNCGFTVPDVSYDLVNQRLSEFSKYVYASSGKEVQSYNGQIPTSYRCWRDLIMTMAVFCNDEACGPSIISMPGVTRAYVTEMAERINTQSVLDRMQNMDGFYIVSAQQDSSDCNSESSSEDDDENEDDVFYAQHEVTYKEWLEEMKYASTTKVAHEYFKMRMFERKDMRVVADSRRVHQMAVFLHRYATDCRALTEQEKANHDKENGKLMGSSIVQDDEDEDE